MIDQVPGGAEFCHWYGGTPSFHDAEIIECYLHRVEPSRLKIRTWRMTAATDSDGMFIVEKHSVVTFTMEGITDLELSGFNHQNVIDGLAIHRTPDGHRLVLEHTWGLSGTLDARHIAIAFEPEAKV